VRGGLRCDQELHLHICDIVNEGSIKNKHSIDKHLQENPKADRKGQKKKHVDVVYNDTYSIANEGMKVEVPTNEFEGGAGSSRPLAFGTQKLSKRY
jgi:hypothetical protein